METQEDPDDTNIGYIWNLKLPKHRDKESKKQPAEDVSDCSQTKLPKFNLVEKLQVIFQKDLITNNPWLNPNASKNHWQKLHAKKRVHFKMTEIQSDSAELPNCWKTNTKIRFGCLHDATCKNSSQETVEILGNLKWLSRANVINPYVKRALELRQVNSPIEDSYVQKDYGKLFETTSLNLTSK